MSSYDLKELAHSNTFHESLDLRNQSTSLLLLSLEKMLLIRAIERQLAEARKDGIIGGPVHLGVGQEAVAVGISHHLRTSDRVFGAHRSHSHIVALGTDPRRLFAEILGRSTGLSKGMGGSMHLFDKSVGFYGSVPIVAGTVSLAVGAAMAARLNNSRDVAVAYFGDGACEEGVVHESLNLASIQKDPVIFVVENNLFASHMHISLRQPYNSTARFAKSNGIPYRIVDGNDVCLVGDVANELISSARQGNGPGFIEAVTYRWYGHVDWREDIDVGINRSQQDLAEWRSKDPIRRLKEALLQNSLLTEHSYELLLDNVTKTVSAAWSQALGDPQQDAKFMSECIYAK
jgi:TPP-dependent pyruvate/acetoin dehydrogenase alpha subunit